MKWFRNGHQLEHTDECVIETTHETSNLKIKNVDKTKAGKYEIVVESVDGLIAKSACSVKLKKPTEEDDDIQAPVFVRYLQPRSIKLGDTLLLETEVISSPNASFQWFIGNMDITSHIKEHKLNNVCLTNRENVSCLCVENITEEFIGVLTCRADNFAGSVSCSASIVLESETEKSTGMAPHFTNPLKPLVVMDGEPIVLSCEVIGKPYPKIVWHRNGEVIQHEKDISIARQEHGMCELCIKEAFPEMSGTYICEAINSYGTCSSECVVIVEGSYVWLHDCMR